MSKSKIRELAKWFWEMAGGQPPFPRDMNTSVPIALPVATVYLDCLTVGSVVAWVSRFFPSYSLPCTDRALHGCLVAFGGQGIIFCDARDTDNEQRFTLAHEAAHMILDYLIPREEAVETCGVQVLEALDGHRPLTIEERVHAIIARQKIGVHTHLLDRTDSVLLREDEANQLALEILAPAHAVREAIRQEGVDPGHDSGAVRHLLVRQFGLPARVAQIYSLQFTETARKFSVREWLGL